jgi:hypothetical protein
MKQTEHRSLDRSDEVRGLSSGQTEIFRIGGSESRWLLFELGRRWTR